MNRHARPWADATVLIGGSPWRISKLGPHAADLVRRLLRAGPTGLPLETAADLAVGRVLLDRGFADPLPARQVTTAQPDIVVPAMDHPDNVSALLASLGDSRVIVVDDGSLNP